MKASKAQSPLEDSPPTTPIEGRRRVTKACQRCRLKKCKCDGSFPCGRCKVDNAICAYGKHKQSNKTVYRKGYVQVLERQHSQLVAGVREMYTLLQNGDGWPGADLEPSSQNDGQPLTHQILEALGVLQTSPEDDGDDLNGEWQTFKHHPQDDGVIYNSAHHSPEMLEPPPPTQTPEQFAVTRHQSFMERQRFKYERDPAEVEKYNSDLPQLTTLLPNLKGGPPLSTKMAHPLQQQQHMFSDQLSHLQAYYDTMGLGDNPSGKSEMMNVDWTGMEDLFDPNPSMVQTG